jgi:hypothetical protein
VTLRDRKRAASKDGNGRSGAQHAATYDYTDADGALLFQKVRNPPGQESRFWLRRPDGKGGWINDAKGVNTGILYHAPGVARAITEGRVVAVVEGEKDANSVRALGLIATCNAHGASELGKRPKWTKAHSEQLRGADIVVFNDKMGLVVRTPTRPATYRSALPSGCGAWISRSIGRRSQRAATLAIGSPPATPARSWRR